MQARTSRRWRRGRTSSARRPWLTIPGQEKWYRSVALLWSFGDDTNTATGGGCRVWNGDIAVLNQDAKYQGTFPTASNFATPFQVAAALYFIVFILAFVSFVLAVLEKVMGLKPFYKGWWGLVYQGLVLSIVFIATVIAGVKFQELNRYTQSNICQYTIQCNGATSHINACSYSSPLVTPLLATANGFLGGIWPGNFGGYLIDGVNVGTAGMPSFPWLQFGYGAGVAITACVVAGFQMFVQFRHYAFETRAGAENKDTSAA